MAKIYFAGSIASGSQYKPQQQMIVKALESLGHEVVSRQHAFQLSGELKSGSQLSAQEIFQRDIWWLLAKSQVVVAELSVSSFGVGFETGLSALLHLPVIAMVAESQADTISAFITGVTDMGQWQVVRYPDDDLAATQRLLQAALAKTDTCHDYPGKYLAIEGLNQSGKNTQIKLLTDKLNQSGIEFELVKEPWTTWLGRQIRHLLQGQLTDVPSLRAEVGLFMAQRAHLIDKVVIPALKQGKLVISDRSLGTSLAFQGSGRDEGILSILGLNSYAVRHLLPDKTVYLRITPDEVKRRQGKEAEEEDGPDRFDYHEQDSFLQACFAGYEQVIAYEQLTGSQDWWVIDGQQSVDQVHQAIWQHLSDWLGL